MQCKTRESLSLVEKADKMSAENEAKLQENKLNIIFADELPEEFIPPDELLEGILTAGDGSVLYGDSNSGKTFLAIDMACAIACGTKWMGRHTEPGLIIYLAAESPASVRRRLQAYQKHYNIRVPNFAIIQNPIDLFSETGDTNLIIQTVKALEAQTGQKARLIVGDTLARISAGANECAGQDMSVVIKHFDQVRTQTSAHFMLIHHSGKNAAAGQRGWSGVRAAIDTEIEITDSMDGRCAEITKQRDLDSKGVRIGFRLEPVLMGVTKWKAQATSCVVLSWDAPPKKGKLLSGAAAAVEEYMYNADQGVSKKVCVHHFSERYHRTTIGRALDALVEDGRCTELMRFYTKVDGKW
jgi:KaiC/GvpD/RAD55 family RecA-like ATPase